MLLSEFNYDLPPELIAQEPLPDRAASRMLVLDRARGTLEDGAWEDRHFTDLPGYLRPGDCLVLNDSRVFPSRLTGRRERGEGGRVEVFLTRPVAGEELVWTALVHPGRKMRTRERVIISDDLSLEIVARGEHGERTVRLHPRGDLYEVLERAGHTPLPPYIRRPDTSADRERYQTVYARERGSVAAPTAGLHFTQEILQRCRAAGAEIARVTLHVGLGTFQPLHTDVLEDVRLHDEWFHVPPETLQAMDRAKQHSGRVIAVGTTCVRVLESAVQNNGAPASGPAHNKITPGPGRTRIFIHPPHEFKIVDALLTNFHLPCSTLLMLVSAFASPGEMSGRETILSAYAEAIRERYRFFSYGDAMLIL